MTAGLAVNWLVFGSSGHKKRPISPNVFEAYDMCMPTDGSNNDTLHVKVSSRCDKLCCVPLQKRDF